jgi:hypothetical protein
MIILGRILWQLGVESDIDSTGQLSVESDIDSTGQLGVGNDIDFTGSDYVRDAAFSKE